MQIQKQIITPFDRIASTYEFILRTVKRFEVNETECTIVDIQQKLGEIGLFDENYLQTGYSDLARTVRKLERWGLLFSRRSKLAANSCKTKHKLLWTTLPAMKALQKLDEMKGTL